jgi:O-antigen/teichoic acid export membrane protein
MFAVAQTVAYFISCVAALVVLKGRIGQFKVKLNLPLLKLILKQSMPFALLVLLMSFYYRVDSVMIERLLPDGSFQTGIYAQAYRLLDASSVIGFLFAGLLLPIFSRMISLKENTTPLIKLSFNLIIVPSLLLFLICYFYGYEIMEVLYHENIVASSEILVLLMGTFVAVASTYILGTFLTANGSLRQLNWIALIGLGINLVLNSILIPLYGPMGAAVATLITQGFVITSQIFVVKRLLNWQMNWNYILRFTGFVVLLLSSSYLFDQVDNTWTIRALLIIFVGLLLALILRIIQPRAIFKILKNKEQH